MTSNVFRAAEDFEKSKVGCQYFTYVLGNGESWSAMKVHPFACGAFSSVQRRRSGCAGFPEFAVPFHHVRVPRSRPGWKSVARGDR